MSTSCLALNVLALCLPEIRQATYILDFATLHVYALFGVERVGVVSTRNTPSYIHLELCYTSCLRAHWRCRIIVKHSSFVRVGIVFADTSKHTPPSP